MDNEAWEALTCGVSCPMCANAKPDNVLTESRSGRVLLVNDGDFRGYMILEYRRHVTEITELSTEERAQLVEDVNACAVALQSTLHPNKINYVILGNEVPHLHVHVIPRYFDDGWWGKPTWLRPAEKKRSLDTEEYDSLRKRLSVVLSIGVNK